MSYGRNGTTFGRTREWWRFFWVAAIPTLFPFENESKFLIKIIVFPCERSTNEIEVGPGIS